VEKKVEKVAKTVTDLEKNIKGMYEKVRAKRRISRVGEEGG
jgi:hypothetical protein